MKQILILLFAITCLNGMAQQDEMYTQFFTNKLAINPAYAGSKEALNILALYRTQWVGFEGSPKTMSFTAHTPILKNTSGIGISIVNDKLGIFNSMILNLSYAFRIDFPIGKLSMGLSGRIQRMQADWTKTNPYNINDSEVPFVSNNLFLPNFGTGIYFYNDVMYAGIAVPHLLNNKYKFDGTNNVETMANAERHYFAMAGALIDLTSDIMLKPAFQFRYAKNSPMGFDFNVNFVFFERLVLGGSVRARDSYSAVAQFWFDKKLSMGYSHDFTFTRLASYHKGTHEIFVSWDLPLKGFGVENPRFF